MRFIKLGAISSTNDYLKDLAKSEPVESYTVVTAEQQTAGRGQRGTSWLTEHGKNLTFSVLIRNVHLRANDLFRINAAVALAIATALRSLNILDVSIKWPNDIMSGNKKLCGILIENTLATGGKITSIIGVGLNVNQTNFDDLPNASSLAIVANKIFDKDEVLEIIVSEIKQTLENEQPAEIWRKYNEMLFRRGLVSNFTLEDQTNVAGTIKSVQENGLVEIDIEGRGVQTFDIKQIKMIY